jgi:ribonuclease P protein subunit POP4
MITPHNIMRHELVGMPVKITKSTHQDFIGLEGKVIDETKNTIIIEDNEGGEKQVPKKDVTFHFTIPDGKIVEIEGKIIVSRPEDRIKKRFKKYG